MSSAVETGHGGKADLGGAPALADRHERRVLVLAPQPFYQDRGTPIALRQVLQALSELGYSVDLLTFPVGDDIALPGLRIRRAANPFAISRVPIGLSARKVVLDLSLLAVLRDQLTRERYTCIHAVEEAAFPAVLLGRRRGIPVLYDMQSSLAEQLLQYACFRVPPVRRGIEALERGLLRRADLVVGSAGLAARVRRLAPGTPVREWRFPSHPLPADPAAAAELRHRLGFAPDQAVVVYSGSFESYQGLPELVGAIPLVLARAPATRFVLVGADRANGFASGDAVAGLLRAGALKLIDRQPREVMGAYHAMADILVSPRAYGGNLPLKVFDYLAAGRPIVATDIPTHRTVLSDERAVLVAPESGSLASGILDLLEDPERAARIASAGRRYAADHLGWDAFVGAVEEIYDEAHGMPGPTEPPAPAARLVSVIIPARNDAATIGDLVRAVQAQAAAPWRVEVVLVDDGSTDATAEVAAAAGARVVRSDERDGGNPAVARNRGALAASGDPLVFLDADCMPLPGWLAALLAAHDAGAAVVGGALDLPRDLSPMARCDYYCGWYHVHSRRPGGEVPNHPPGNLSVRREVFAGTRGFTEQQPIAYAHEELAWQAEVRRAGGRIVFEPRAIVQHRNRPGFANLLRRNYRWGFSAIESKAPTGAARQAWVYRHPALLVAVSLPLAFGSAAYVVGCWLRAGVLEPLLMSPAVLAARLAYSAGLAAGGLRWMRHGEAAAEVRPRWE